MTDLSELTIPDLVKQINTEYEAILVAERSNLAKAIAIGEKLAACKRRLEHGEWEAWLRKNCPKLSLETARLYMRLAAGQEELAKQAKAKSVSVTDMTISDAREALAKPRSAEGSKAKPKAATLGAVVEPGDSRAKSASTSPDQIIMALDAEEIFDILKTDSDKLRRLYDLLREHVTPLRRPLPLAAPAPS
jgi:hypothetical protein